MYRAMVNPKQCVNVWFVVPVMKYTSVGEGIGSPRDEVGYTNSEAHLTVQRRNVNYNHLKLCIQIIMPIAPKISPTAHCWFIRDSEKLIQCSKDAFDKAIIEGKSVKYHGYANRQAERIAEQLEESRMALLAKPELPTKLRLALTNPKNLVEVQIIRVDDPQFWTKESKRAKYQM